MVKKYQTFESLPYLYEHEILISTNYNTGAGVKYQGGLLSEITKICINGHIIDDFYNEMRRLMLLELN